MSTQIVGLAWTAQLASGVTAAYSAPSTPQSASLPTWIQVVGSGTVAVTNEDGTTGTFTCSGGETLQGTFLAVTTNSATRLRIGSGNAPPPIAGGVNVQAVNLAGGSGSVTGVLPGTNAAAYANAGATVTGAFTGVVGTMHKINPSGATFAYTLPAISATNDGQRIAVVNVSTGTTATVATPTGSDNVGNSAGSATGATAAGPTGGAVKVYTADNTTKAWLVGI